MNNAPTKVEISFDTFWHENYPNAIMNEFEETIKAMLKRAYLSGAEYIVNRIEENV